MDAGMQTLEQLALATEFVWEWNLAAFLNQSRNLVALCFVPAEWIGRGRHDLAP